MSEWRALSFSQPWLDFVMRAARGEPDPKLVENRRWNTALRGPFILHAAKSFDREAGGWVSRAGIRNGYTARESLPCGGFVGVARLLHVLRPDAEELLAGASVRREEHDLRWWMREQFGFLLADVRALPFREHRGMLGFWKVSERAVASMGLPPTPEEWAP